MDPGDLDNAEAEQREEDVQDGLAIDVEEMQEDEIHEDEQMAVDIDDILTEDFLDHGVPQLLAEVDAAHAQVQEQSTEDEELEEELDEEEQQLEEIDEEQQQPEEMDVVEQQSEEIC